MSELVNFICPICKLLYYGDKCLHRYSDVLLFQAAEIERLNKALDEIANAEYPASDYQHPFGMLVRIENVKAITDIAHAALEGGER